ncbi:MAG: cation:proton antiporter [Phycisphaerales bacterium]
MTEINTILVIVAASILMLGFLSNWIKDKLPVSEALICVAIGVLVGRAGWVDPATLGDPKRVLEVIARLTVAIAVTGAALQLPDGYFRRWRQSLLVVLGPGMILMWFAGALIVYSVLGLPFWTAMLIGACVTPTDPVLAGSIVRGQGARKNLPDDLKNLISAESAANDGLAYPFIFLAVLGIQHGLAEAARIWIFGIVLWGVVCASLMGAAIGAAAGCVFTVFQRRGYFGGVPLLTITVALSILSVAVVRLVGSDGILAGFTAGLAFRRVANVSERQEDFHESIKSFFGTPAFILLGMLLPFGDWCRQAGVLSLTCVAILLLRRPPEILLQKRWIAPWRPLRNALFAGWFGPIGTAWLYYAMLTSRQIGDDRVWTVVSAVVLSSILAHGVTATPLTNLYGRTTTLPKTGSSGTDSNR